MHDALRLPPFSTISMSNGWTARIATVTPEFAMELLQRNVGNRALRVATVVKYALAMKAGEWILSPEPICIGVDGRLLNGQHRLHAVVRAQRPQQFMVVTNVDPEVFAVLDRGLVRSFQDASGIERKLSDMARVFAGTMTDEHAGKSIPDYAVRNACSLLRGAFLDMQERRLPHVKVISSAPFRLAVCLRHLTEDEPFAMDQYEAVCRMEPEHLAPMPRSIMQGAAYGRLLARVEYSASYGLALGWTAFDVDARRSTGKPQAAVRNVDKVIAEIREVFADWIPRVQPVHLPEGGSDKAIAA